MTEGEWLACGEPDRLLGFIGAKADERKLRLFAIACVRRVLHLLTDERSREALLFAQAHEDEPTRMIGRSAAHATATEVSTDIARFFGQDLLTPPTNPRSRGTWIQHRAANAAALVIAASAAHAARMSSIHAAIALQLDSEWESPKEERARQAALLRDVLGNPFRPVTFDPAWRTSDAVLLARGMYESRDFGAMPILADALQDAGCTSDDLLNHLRDPNATHVRGCWALDLVLGKE